LQHFRKIFLFYPILVALLKGYHQMLMGFMKLKVAGFTSILLLAFCWSCTKHNIVDDVAPPPCDTTGVTFAGTIFPIFTNYCSNQSNGDCHFSGAVTGKPDYTAYAGIKQKIDDGRIQARLFDANPTQMPPSYSSGPRDMSDCEKSKILSWISAGAPNN
jgi:hypothetical protein